MNESHNIQDVQNRPMGSYMVVNSWLSGIQASGILTRMVNILKKIYRLSKLIYV
jgi:hypothetical protein